MAGKGHWTAKGWGLRDWKGRAVLSEENGQAASIARYGGHQALTVTGRGELSLAGTVTRSWLGKTKNLPERELQ